MSVVSVVLVVVYLKSTQDKKETDRFREESAYILTWFARAAGWACSKPAPGAQ